MQGSERLGVVLCITATPGKSLNFSYNFTSHINPATGDEVQLLEGAQLDSHYVEKERHKLASMKQSGIHTTIRRYDCQ